MFSAYGAFGLSTLRVSSGLTSFSTSLLSSIGISSSTTVLQIVQVFVCFPTAVSVAGVTTTASPKVCSFLGKVFVVSLSQRVHLPLSIPSSEQVGSLDTVGLENLCPRALISLVSL